MLSLCFRNRRLLRSSQRGDELTDPEDTGILLCLREEDVSHRPWVVSLCGAQMMMGTELAIDAGFRGAFCESGYTVPAGSLSLRAVCERHHKNVRHYYCISCTSQKCLQSRVNRRVLKEV